MCVHVCPVLLVLVSGLERVKSVLVVLVVVIAIGFIVPVVVIAARIHLEATKGSGRFRRELALKSFLPLLFALIARDDIVGLEPCEKFGQEFINGASKLEFLVVGDTESASLDGPDLLVATGVGVVSDTIQVEEGINPVAKRMSV